MKIGIKHCLLEMSDWNRLDVNELTSAYAGALRQRFSSWNALRLTGDRFFCQSVADG